MKIIIKKSRHNIVLISLLSFLTMYIKAQDNSVSSPDGKIVAKVFLDDQNNAKFDILLNDIEVLKGCGLGLVREDMDFSDNLAIVSISDIEKVSDSYALLHGKKKDANYKANKRVYHLQNKNEAKLDLIFQVSDDGVAFRYYFPDESENIMTILEEKTSYIFKPGTKTWIQPMAKAKSGWKRSNPSYEEDYEKGVDVTSLKKSEPGWVYPALFKSNNSWICITESAPYRDYCGTRLMHKEGSLEFTIGFPSQLETKNEKEGANPNSKLPWYTPWRIMAIGDDPGIIIESTLGTDLAKPNVLDDISFVKPGRASWSWVMLKDDSIIYPVQKRFIDYSAEMGWEYSLIDVNWNIKIGYDKIKELADYAASKNVGLILWYNSAGTWNDTPYEPKSMLLTEEDRDKEFARLKEMGIKGVKVDFFGGDGQDMMGYYLDIFESAAKYGIMVNTHGCTLPRGWHRTYPNLVTMESIKGEEFCTFFQDVADNQPAHCCVIPFTRNAFDPMDFTPVVFGEIPFRERATTNSFELALAVLFLSGVQHYAETDYGMKKVPDHIRQYMKDIPVIWDETKFVQGYPGKLVVIARKKGKTWYVAGINGEKKEKEITLDLSFIKNKNGELISDITNRETKIENIKLPKDKSYAVKLLPNGGFVMRFEK